MAQLDNIKKVQITANDYSDIEALHFKSGDLDTPAQWKAYIDSIADLGFEIFTDLIGKTLPAADATSYAKYKNGIVLCNNGETPETGSYIEWIIVDKGASANPRYTWEKIGTTSTDLTDYYKKGVTYTGAALSAGETTTSTPSTANVTGSGTYQIAKSATGSAGSTATATTSKTSGGTVDFTKASFSGTTATITSSGSYTPAGTISKPAVNLSVGATITYVDGVKSGGTTQAITSAIKGLTSSTTTSTGAVQYVESFTHAGASLGTPSTTIALTGVTYDGSDTAIKSLGTATFVTGPTVNSNGVLSFLTASAYNSVSSTFTAIKGVKANGTATVITGYPNFAGGSATPTTKYLTGTAATDKATVILSTGLNTATFNNYTSAALATAPVFYGTAATISVTASYQPAGGISGTQTLTEHNHTYVSLPAHTHGIETQDATVEVTVSLGNHTHNIGNHTHSIYVPVPQS